MSNRLANETSPYLLQHADNPVEWYPWGGEALAQAEAEDKPILLSIGYAACHWCHVMAHESFEDPETSAFMNEHFINIKVDREERPDLDSIYMNAVVAMTGQGGWPMTVVLTPGGEPFFGGTYFPPSPRYGMPSFKQVLASIAHSWTERREDIVNSAVNITEHIRGGLSLSEQRSILNQDTLEKAQVGVANTFDSERGGFGRAPKFPQAMTIEFLIQRFLETGNEQALHMAEFSLEMMAHGGIYDQVGGGFARYSTDDNWLVPHFEKMLYDNALLSRAYLHAWQVTGNPLYRQVVEETLDWTLKEMSHELGGFFSSLDADSEGKEGKFYVWSAAEIHEALGEDAGMYMLRYGVLENGNWEGKNILHVAKSVEQVAEEIGNDNETVRRKLSAAREKLYRVRVRRVWPGLDDKVLTAWNGLMLASLAEAGRVLNRRDYTDAAIANAEFLNNTMRRDNGRLLRTWKAGSEARLNGYLEDYAYLADGLLALYQNTFEVRWFIWAHEIVDLIVIHFLDEEHGGFFDTSDDHESLIHRPKDLQDNAVPSGNSMAANVLLQDSLYSGELRYADIAEKSISAMQKPIVQHPTGFGQWLCAASFILGDPKEVAIAGDIDSDDTRSLINTIFASYRPHLVVAVGEDTGQIPLLVNRDRQQGKATAYVCRRFLCKAPVTSPEALDMLLRE
jgi:uncharacterized protein YyaL (SSP411 family)